MLLKEGEGRENTGETQQDPPPKRKLERLALARLGPQGPWRHTNRQGYRDTRITRFRGEEWNRLQTAGWNNSDDVSLAEGRIDTGPVYYLAALLCITLAVTTCK